MDLRKLVLYRPVEPEIVQKDILVPCSFLKLSQGIWLILLQRTTKIDNFCIQDELLTPSELGERALQSRACWFSYRNPCGKIMVNLNGACSQL